MKRISWLYVPILCVLVAGAACASEGVDEVIRLQQGGINARVMQAYVENSTVAYDPSAAEIQKLEDAGVPATVIVAMIDHGKALRKEPVPAPAAPNPSPSRTAGTETVSAPSDPRPGDTRYVTEVVTPPETV